MRFKILKSSMDGISGGASNYENIDEVLREVSYHKGWSSLSEMHNSIREWSKKCRPGDVYCTQVTGIVAVAVDRLDRSEGECRHCLHKQLYYEQFNPVEDGNVEQKVRCGNCGKKWKDVFVLAEQHEMSI